MVSIVLLTTEEVLQRNGFWFCLDSDWITEEMEPFEDIKPQDLFSKPLSRDFYYAKFPEIPRSESEDENSLTLSGFQIKHRAWKSKIKVKRFYAQKRNSCNLSCVLTTSCASLNVRSNKVASTSRYTRLRTTSESGVSARSNDKKTDFVCLPFITSPPPPAPPVIIITNASITESLEQESYCHETELPHADFENNKFNISNLKDGAPITSTPKKKRKVSFNLITNKEDDFDFQQSWNESIYGVKDFGVQIISKNSSEYWSVNENNELENESCNDDYPSWTDIVNECGTSACLSRSWTSIEELISKSHKADDSTNQFLQEDDDSDDEATYARFANYKIHQTLSNKIGMTDSSSMKDLIHENNEQFAERYNMIIKGTSFLDDVYRIAPKADGEEFTSSL